jgi:hypothetical protein
VSALAVDSHGTKWFGTSGSTATGVHALWGGADYAVSDNAQWLDLTHWRATYDLSALVPRDTYTVTVSGASGLDRLEIPRDTRFRFTVDYAGQISDQTPPNTPWVLASGKSGDPSYVEAVWFASDPDSSITGYRYAIGSAAGANDIVNWTNLNGSTLVRGSLGLVSGRRYYLSVQAQNIGGLWSPPGISTFIAAQPAPRIYLPAVIR